MEYVDCNVVKARDVDFVEVLVSVGMEKALIDWEISCIQIDAVSSTFGPRLYRSWVGLMLYVGPYGYASVYEWSPWRGWRKL